MLTWFRLNSYLQELGETFARTAVNPVEPDFGDLALVAFGNAGWWLVQGSIISSQIGKRGQVVAKQKPVWMLQPTVQRANPIVSP